MAFDAAPWIEEVLATPRKAMGPARRARILSQWGHVCAEPGCDVAAGLEIDHTIALELGGPDVDENCRPLCNPHHKQKTKADRKAIAKVKRLIARRDGTRRPRQAIKSPGFKTGQKGFWPPGRKLPSQPFGR